MGTGAGTKLLKEIGNAQKSVKISSPYLSPKMVDELIWLHGQGIKISLITSDSIDGHNGRQGESIKPLVIQNRCLDQRARKSRNRLKIIRRFFLAIAVLVIGFLLYRFFSTNEWSYMFSMAFPLALFASSTYLGRKIRRRKIYAYSYSQLFPFRVFVTPDSNWINDTFIHGKIYIIDGHTAYLGSLNFTESGTKYNYETRIRVADIDAVKKMEKEFDELYDNEELVYFGIEEWGKRLHFEPIN